MRKRDRKRKKNFKIFKALDTAAILPHKGERIIILKKFAFIRVYLRTYINSTD